MIDTTAIQAVQGFVLAFTLALSVYGIYLSRKQVQLEQYNNQAQNTKIITSLQSIDRRMELLCRKTR